MEQMAKEKWEALFNRWIGNGWLCNEGEKGGEAPAICLSPQFVQACIVISGPTGDTKLYKPRLSSFETTLYLSNTARRDDDISGSFKPSVIVFLNLSWLSIHPWLCENVIYKTMYMA